MGITVIPSFPVTLQFLNYYFPFTDDKTQVERV